MNEPVYLTDLEAQLASPAGPQLRFELISQLEAEHQSTGRQLQKGLNPADYEAAQLKRSALAAAVSVLKAFNH